MINSQPQNVSLTDKNISNMKANRLIFFAGEVVALYLSALVWEMSKVGAVGLFILLTVMFLGAMMAIYKQF